MAKTEGIHVLCVGEIGGSGFPDVEEVGSITAVDVSTEGGAIRQLREGDVECIVVGHPFVSDPRGLINHTREHDPSVPIILVGEPDGPDEVIEALNAGATRYLRTAEAETDLSGLINHLTDDNRIHTAIDRHREFTTAVWVAAAKAVLKTHRREIEATVHDTIDTAESIEWVWIARQVGGEGLIDVREPFNSTLHRSQVALMFGESGVATIDRALEADEVQSFDTTTTNEVLGRTIAVVPIPIDGDPDGLLLLTATSGTSFDNTDRASLRRFSRAVGRLVSLIEEEADTATRTDAVMELVSHEVRNPLTTAMSSLQIAKETSDREAFDRIQRALEEIDRTISTLNTLYSGNRDDRTTDKPFESTAQRAWEDTATPVADLELNDIGRINAHHDLLERLLVNLFRNAIQYSPGEVTVRVGRLPNGFYVEDDGPGVPPEHKASIFDWGFTTSDSGFGVGLALVEDITGYHGWSIELADGQSGGARFEITGVDIEPAVDSHDDRSERVTDQ